MRPTRAQGARASFTVGLIVALIVGLAAAAPSEGKDCQSDTMLPSDVRVTIPGADVPAQLRDSSHGRRSARCESRRYLSLSFTSS